MDTRHDYNIVSRYFDGEWKEEVIELKDKTFVTAGVHASNQAKKLDERFGDKGSWRVDIYNPDKPEYGSYYQLFHGRLS